MGVLMETTEANLGTASYRSRQTEAQVFGAMGSPTEYYGDALHTIAIKTRETEFGSIVEPIPITLKTYKQLQARGHQINGYFPPHHTLSSLITAPRPTDYDTPTTSTVNTLEIKEEVKEVPKPITRAPPKKKWIKEYLEEEPKSPVSVRVVSVGARGNGLVRPVSPVVAPPPEAVPPAPAPALAPAPLDFAQEHSRPRTTSISAHGPTQIPSPPSVGSNGSGSGSNGSGSGSAPRAGTREVHNKLEKNRRAHLKECFELLKRQLPATPDDKKTSNLSILGSAIRYIQVLRRKERECEHEMERLAREKIAAQQRLAALKREVSVRATPRPRAAGPFTSRQTCDPDPITEDKDREEHVNGVLGISISSSSPPRAVDSPPHSLNLSTKLRALPIQISPTTAQQVVRTTYGARHNTLTLTTLASPDGTTQQNGECGEKSVSGALSTALVHPAQIHLPLSQVVSSGGVVVGGALQLVSAGGGLRVLHAPLRTANGVTVSSVDNSRIPKPENGIVAPTTISTTDGSSVVVSGLTPIVVSQPTTHLLHTHTLTHKMVEGVGVGVGVEGVQYVGGLVKPVVVVSRPP